MLKHVGKNFLILLSGDLINKVFGFIIFIYLARVLGASAFGNLSFAQAILAYFLLITDLGLSTAGARELARNKGDVLHSANNISSLRFIFTCVSFFLLVLVSIFIPKPQEIKLLILFYGFYLFPFSLLLDWVFQGLELMKYIALSKVISRLIYFILVIFLVRSNQTLLLIPWFWFIGGIGAALFLIISFNSKFGHLKLSIDPIFCKKLLCYAIPMGASNMMSQVYYNMDTVMLGFLKGSAVVGWYNAVYQLVLGILGLGLLLSYATFPILSDAYKDKERFKFVCKRYGISQFILGFLVIIAGIPLAKQIILLLFGVEYLSAVFAFRILILTLGIIFINNAFSIPLLATKFEKDILINTACISVLNLGLNFLLIPKFSLEGASIATLLSETVSLGMIMLFYRKRFRQ